MCAFIRVLGKLVNMPLCGHGCVKRYMIHIGHTLILANAVESVLPFDKLPLFL